MSLTDYFNKVALAASLAKAAQREELKKILLEIGKEARAVQVESDLDLVADKFLDRVIATASTLQITNAVGREIWTNLKDKYTGDTGDKA